VIGITSVKSAWIFSWTCEGQKFGLTKPRIRDGKIMPLRANILDHLKSVEADLHRRLKRMPAYPKKEAAEFFLLVIAALKEVNELECMLVRSFIRRRKGQQVVNSAIDFLLDDSQLGKQPRSSKEKFAIGILLGRSQRFVKERQQKRKEKILCWLRLRGTRIIESIRVLELEKDPVLLKLLPIKPEEIPQAVAVAHAEPLDSPYIYKPREKEHKNVANIMRQIGSSATYEDVMEHIDENHPTLVQIFAPRYCASLRKDEIPRLVDALKNRDLMSQFQKTVREVRSALKEERLSGDSRKIQKT
jgi:transposase